MAHLGIRVPVSGATLTVTHSDPAAEEETIEHRESAWHVVLMFCI